MGIMYTQIRINSLPIGINCYDNGCVEFYRVHPFHTMVEYLGDGTQIVISNDDVVVGTERYEYGEQVYYKNEPQLLSWLVMQRMVIPDTLVIYQ